ncbi:uncharacterized protein LOC117083969 isoform X1 [Trachypithecus francoisi]|uniref:uncharacterized protein LOC117083969 isoform X1 n=1 Tax=Trachypithecus francoisi TaxID=54180 RepID=UPI00141AE88A|nr:uncharacterized protein LOC117083969 isoform X1 [Trachypithecus francoisi]
MQGLVGEEHEELGVGAGGERSRSLTQVAAGLRVAVSDLTRSRALLPDPNSLRSGLARARFPRGRPGLWRPRPWRAGHASALTLSCYRDSRRRPGRARISISQTSSDFPAGARGSTLVLGSLGSSGWRGPKGHLLRGCVEEEERRFYLEGGNS